MKGFVQDNTVGLIIAYSGPGHLLQHPGALILAVKSADLLHAVVTALAAALSAHHVAGTTTLHVKMTDVSETTIVVIGTVTVLAVLRIEIVR